MPKMLAAKNTKLTWVPDLTDPSAPTAAELNAGLHIECLVSAQNFSLGVSDEETVTDPALCSNANAQAPGRVTFGGEMDFFRFTDSSEDAAWDTFTQANLDGYLVKRIGMDHSVAYASAQDVMVYEMKTGTPMVQTPDNNGTAYEKFRQKFYGQDFYDEHAAVA